MKKLFSLAFIMIACSLFTACGVQKDVGISSISLNNNSAVIEIYEGEFNEAGITATIVYEDDTTETITVTEDMLVEKIIEGQLWYKVPGTYAVAFLLKGETVNFTVKVLPKYVEVRFFDGYGRLINKQSIRKGSNAVAPNDGYTISGMEFIGWDRTFTNLTKDTDVYAIYSSITALDIETGIKDWQYRVRDDEQGSNVYEFYKFQDGKVYYYFGSLEEFLENINTIESFEYTANYRSEVRDVIYGVWKIYFEIRDIEHTIYYSNNQLFTSLTDSAVYYKQFNSNNALKTDCWYQWAIDTESKGFIRLSGKNVEYYRGISLSNNENDYTKLNYTMNINNEGNLVIITQETSSVQSLTITCGKELKLNDMALSIVE